MPDWPGCELCDIFGVYSPAVWQVDGPDGVYDGCYVCPLCRQMLSIRRKIDEHKRAIARISDEIARMDEDMRDILAQVMRQKEGRE